MGKIYLVMPAYNESDNIKQTIAQWYPVVEKLNGGAVVMQFWLLPMMVVKIKRSK